MIVYWLMFLFAAGCALVGSTRQASLSQGMQSTRLNIYWAMIWLALTVLIGFRFEVGGDWFNYERIFRYFSYYNFEQALERGDPAYSALNWWAANNGYSTTLVNLVCGAIFAIGLVTFARQQPLPWLAMARPPSPSARQRDLPRHLVDLHVHRLRRRPGECGPERRHVGRRIRHRR